MNKIPNRQAICEVLMDRAKEDKNIVVLCSDSRGSASMTPFAMLFQNSLLKQALLSKILSVFQQVLLSAAKRRLPVHLHVFFQQEAMSRQR